MKDLWAIKTILHMALWNGYTQRSGNSLSEIAKAWIKQIRKKGQSQKVGYKVSNIYEVLTFEVLLRY